MTLGEVAMHLWIHIVLLLAVIFVPVPLAVGFRQGPRRTFMEIADSPWPFLVLAILSVLTVSAYGKPFQEWLLPALAALVLAIFCRDDRLYRISWWNLVCVAVLLCFNVLIIFGEGEYVRDRIGGLQMKNIQGQLEKNAAHAAMEKAFRPETVIKEGPVANILKDPSFNNLEIVSAEQEWHSGFTWLFRLQRDKAILWYPGGDVESASKHLELRKAD